jgi:hypothetical protein
MLVMHIGARAGVIWIPEGTDLRAKASFHRVARSARPTDLMRSEHLLEQATISGQGLVRAAYGGSLLDHADSDEGDSLVYAIPIKRLDRVIAVIEIDQESVATVDLRQKHLQIIEQICTLSSNRLAKLMDADGLVEQPQSLKTQSVVVSREPFEKTDAEATLDTSPVPDGGPTVAMGEKRWWQVWTK